MVHQYDLDTAQTSLENAYNEFLSNIKDPHARNEIINKTLGKDNLKQNLTKQDYISLFNPNADFVESYNKRSIKEATKKAKEDQAKNFNEQGQQYHHLHKHEGFKHIHDPLSKSF